MFLGVQVFNAKGIFSCDSGITIESFCQIIFLRVLVKDAAIFENMREFVIGRVFRSYSEMIWGLNSLH